MYELIITEKPSAAKKVAEALADSKPKKENFGQVPYYRLTHKGKDIVEKNIQAIDFAYNCKTKDEA